MVYVNGDGKAHSIERDEATGWVKRLVVSILGLIFSGLIIGLTVIESIFVIIMRQMMGDKPQVVTR